MARTNHLPGYGIRLLYRIRQQLRSNWWCYWPAVVSKHVRTTLHSALLCCHGSCGYLRDIDSGDVVGDLGHGARHEAVEAS